jgi:membrane-bound lytic murein transglycosylase D
MRKIFGLSVFAAILFSGCSNVWFEGRGMDVGPSSTTGSLPRPIFAVTPEVQSELRHFTSRDRAFISGSFDRLFSDHSAVYSVFNRQGLPTELLTIAMIESRFEYDARSHAGAVGLWQLMPATARSYGLRVDHLHDERRDPVRATYAASTLLKDLYAQFGNWELALAAYNAGPTKVRRAMNYAQTENFWTLARRGLLRNETKRFVARVIAASIIGRSPKTYGFNAVALG